MRAIVAVTLFLLLASGPAAARDWSDTAPYNPLELRRTPPPPTEADLERAEAAAKPHPRTEADDLSDRLGLTDGRAEFFRYQSDGGSDAGLRGSIGGDGATVELRW